MNTCRHVGFLSMIEKKLWKDIIKGILLSLDPKSRWYQCEFKVGNIPPKKIIGEFPPQLWPYITSHDTVHGTTFMYNKNYYDIEETFRNPFECRVTYEQVIKIRDRLTYNRDFDIMEQYIRFREVKKFTCVFPEYIALLKVIYDENYMLIPHDVIALIYDQLFNNFPLIPPVDKSEIKSKFKSYLSDEVIKDDDYKSYILTNLHDYSDPLIKFEIMNVTDEIEKRIKSVLGDIEIVNSLINLTYDEYWKLWDKFVRNPVSNLISERIYVSGIVHVIVDYMF
jgi:hypothetical protein